MNEKSSQMKGILFILLAAFFYAMTSIFIRQAGPLPTMQKSFFRNAVAALFVVFFLIVRKQKVHIQKKEIPHHLLRGIFGMVSTVCNYYAIDHMNIADANMLNKLSAIFAIVFSALILKEKTKRIDWLCIGTAFIGVLFVLKPSFSEGTLVGLIAAFGGLGAGVATVFVRLLGERGESSASIVLFFSCFAALFMLPFMLHGYQPMQMRQFLCLVGCGMAAMGGQMSITTAYQYAPARRISIFDYSQIIYAGIFAFLFFGEIPDKLSILGYIIITGGAVWRWRVTLKDTAA